MSNIGSVDNELWKDVVGYEGLYEVSNYGRLRSLDRDLVSIDGKVVRFEGRMRIASDNGSGYLYLPLSKDGVRKNHLVHRLVATAFIENGNPDHDIVNHIDENPKNNHASNLEWCDAKYNMNYGNKISKSNATYQKNRKLGKHGAVGKPKTAVRIFDDKGFRKDFNSVKELTDYLSCSRAAVSKVLTGKQKTLKGYSVEKIEERIAV